MEMSGGSWPRGCGERRVGQRRRHRGVAAAWEQVRGRSSQRAAKGAGRRRRAGRRPAKQGERGGGGADREEAFSTPSRLGESGFCAGDGSRRSGDAKRSRRFPGVWLGRGERGDGMTPG